ncbi:tetratricopeptide repeat protein [Plastoroseomonas hellenica]|uniref:tetratricopeptide repeat protein n=1 Tax=Plastoroseomonas hellenica TaxID=2687306 RepID=UPI001BA578A1|nr:tetratricopeptide repeat protein [Plastoroseomonas hellenica]MBR0643104.1 tetratricopeptide repeat protein [Plastoroseomonas hellenica]
MTHRDRYGLELSTASDAAAALYREGSDLLLATWPGAAEAFDAAIADDPDFALARASRARLHAIRGEAGQARAAIAAARALAERHGTERERGQVAILALAIEGHPAQALRQALAHLDTWPRDALVLSLPLGAFGLFAFSGMADHDQARVDLCERHARHYGDDWWFLTYRGWSHVENGDPGAGRALVQRAFALRRHNANAVHALAHAMFEEGSGQEAEALVAGWLPEYGRAGLLYGHISWHQALVALDDGDAARALAIYTDRVQPQATLAAPINIVTDGASFLWRLHAYGHAVPKPLWEEAAAYADRAFPKGGNAFVEVHLAMLAAATGDRARAEAGATVAGPVVPAIHRALLAFADGDYGGCARILAPVAAEVVRIGGSHAQREVIEDTLLIALMRSGAAAQARALLDDRLHRRPSRRDSGWRAALVA